LTPGVRLPREAGMMGSVRQEEPMVDGEAQRSEEIEAPAQAVWELLADFGGIAGWWPGGLEKVENEGDGIGMVRTIHTFGLVIREKLEALDPAERQLELSIEGPAPAGITDYRARGHVVEVTPGRCRLKWRGRFRVAGEGDVETARTFLETGYAAMFQGLAEQAGRSPRSAGSAS
jgi:carbon monoxide dehydrogenase subunit G